MSSDPWSAERATVCETAQELDRLGLVAGASGNVSLLFPANRRSLPSRRAGRTTAP